MAPVDKILGVHPGSLDDIAKQKQQHFISNLATYSNAVLERFIALEIEAGK